jgi:uncharacterized protein (DUF488 family)
MVITEANVTQVWTIGHSTRAADEFVELLNDNEIATLVDVRSYPSSRRLPHFNRDALASFLSGRGIEYRHMPRLGGRRKPNPNSKNVAWTNASFRAYADYMETDEFVAGVRELLEVARENKTVIMCAEALWWRCHRSLISDYLKSIGVEVTHIVGKSKVESHRYTAPASTVEGKLSYQGLLASRDSSSS